MVGHITYMSDISMDEKFGRRFRKNGKPEFKFDPEFEVEGYSNTGARASSIASTRILTSISRRGSIISTSPTARGSRRSYGEPTPVSS
jgi:hypothetical protein